MATGRVPTTANSPLTAKGDLFGYSTTQARVPVGSDGETLVADSSATTGLRWTATPSASNPVLNSSFDIWQRGTSLTTTAIDSDYTADRWYSFTTGATSGRTISRQATGDTTNLPFIEYCARIQRDSGNTSTAQWQFFQPFETTNAIPFAGRTVTLSFYARRGANFSSGSNVLRVILTTGTGTDQNPISGYTGGADVIDQNVTLTTTWQRFSLTASIGSSVKELAPNFLWIPSGTAGAADFYEITGVQIDIGSVALPYRRNSATLAGELAACQRYYWRFGGDSAYQIFGFGVASTTTNANIGIQFPVPMRVAPTSVDFATLGVGDTIAISSAVSAIAIGNNSKFAALLNVASSSMTARHNYWLRTDNSTAGYLGFNAEL